MITVQTPLTKDERDNNRRWATEIWEEQLCTPPILGKAWHYQRYEATIKTLEEELAAVTKERDEYHRLADTWIPDFCEGKDDLADVAWAQQDRQGGMN